MSLVRPQLGLLEDDQVYRLSLLAVNVLEPLKKQYPNVIVTSGLRQPNSGIGQHELGEAVDIQIRNQTPTLLYEVADYIRKFLPFDQLVLNWTDIGDKHGWIHVSFSPTSLREQVLTKDFADAFHEGLFLCVPQTGEAAAAALRAQAADDAAILKELTNMQTRQDRLTPPSVNPEKITAGQLTGAGGPPLDNAHLQLIQCVVDALYPTISAYSNPLAAAFEVTRRVAWLLRDEHAGLLIKAPNDAFATVLVNPYGNYTVSAVHLSYPNGQTYVVFDPVKFAVSGVNDGVVDPARHLPAIDPGTNLTSNWLSCRL